MLKPLDAALYFCLWVNVRIGNVVEVVDNNLPPRNISCTTTVNMLLTNDDYCTVEQVEAIVDELLKDHR